jgi:hypothetical protein
MTPESVSKQDAIRRQLDTAIWLWFQDDDSVSIHTLACSALKVAHDIGQKLGKPAMLFEHLPKELAKDAVAAQGFFKHAKDDPDDVLTFNSGITPYHIYDAANCYKAIYSSLSPLMTTFIIRFLLVHPNIGSVDLPASLGAFAKSDLAAMGKEKFFDAVFPILNR